MNLFYGLLVGVAMGVLIQRAGASSPRMIAAALRLENIAIIKFMAMTIAVGTVTVYVINQFMPMHFDIKPTYIAGVFAGGLIFGVGFAVAGYCPGTCVVGAGEGRRDAWVAILGGIVGATVFSLVYKLLERPLVQSFNYGRITIPDVLHASGPLVAVILGLALLAAVTLIPTVRD